MTPPSAAGTSAAAPGETRLDAKLEPDEIDGFAEDELDEPAGEEPSEDALPGDGPSDGDPFDEEDAYSDLLDDELDGGAYPFAREDPLGEETYVRAVPDDRPLDLTDTLSGEPFGIDDPFDDMPFDDESPLEDGAPFLPSRHRF